MERFDKADNKTLQISTVGTFKPEDNLKTNLAF